MSAPRQTRGEPQSQSFEDRVKRALPTLSPTEHRVARFFRDQKEALLLGTAVEIAALAGASDATVVRTARALGFDGLADLRETALTDLTNNAPSAIDDGSLALLAAVLIALVTAAVKMFALPPFEGAMLLLAGCILVLADSVRRAARRRR